MSFAGIVRTLVAVGTVRLESMLDASAFDAPFNAATVLSGSAAGASVVAAADGAFVGASAGIGWGLACTEVVFAIGWLPVGGLAVGGVAGAVAGTTAASGASPPAAVEVAGSASASAVEVTVLW